MKKRILIIGGAGFIGINAAKKFLDDGHAVTIFDNLSRLGTAFNIAWLDTLYKGTYGFVKGDVRYDQALLETVVAEHDVVFHLAAQVAVTTSVVDPRTDFEINAGGTFNVLEAIRQSSNKPLLVFTSTNKVFGDLENLQIDEQETRYVLRDFPHGISASHSLDFHSPYGCSKGAADQYVHDYARIYGLKTVVLRQSCIYGYNQFGIEDQGWIAWFIIAFLTKKSATLYGNGKQVRDVLFIDDLVNLYQLLMDHEETVSGKVYTVGGGADNTLSLLEFIDILKTKHGLSLTYDTASPRPGDQKVFVSDNRALAEAIGWVPVVSCEKGVGLLVAWVQEHLSEIAAVYKSRAQS